MNISSVGSNKYFLTFVDDFSRKTWIYLLKNKDEVFHCFKIFKTFVERESGRQIKMVRSDEGVSTSLMSSRGTVKNLGCNIT